MLKEILGASWVALSGLAVGCDMPFKPGETGPVTTAVVFGTVMVGQAPLVELSLEAWVDPTGDCPASSNHFTGVPVLEASTDTAGQYSVEVRLRQDDGGPAEACVRISTSEPDTSLSAGPVRMSREEEPTDSVQVNIVFPGG